MPLPETGETRPNDIVWREHGGKLLPAVVHFARGRTLEVVGADGTSQTLAPRRIVHVSDRPLRVSPGDPAAAARALSRLQAEVEAAASSLDLRTLWELLAEEAEGGLTLDDLAELGFGESSGVSRDAMALALFGDAVYFKQRKEGFVANPRRTVEELERQRARAEEEDETVTRFAAALRGDPAAADALSDAFALLEELALHGEEAPRYRRGCHVLESLGMRGRGDVAHVAFRQLVRHGVFGEDEDLNLRRLRLGRPFSAEGLREAEAVARRGITGLANGRCDLRGLLTVAIDDAHTTEVDDALAIEERPDGGATVHVLIADATAFVEHLGAVDDEARRRGATLYHPVERYYMLPSVLSEGVASLLAEQDRLALDFAVDVGRGGELEGVRIREALVRVDRRLTYDAVDAMLEGAEEGGDGDGPDAPVRKLLRSLLRHARARRDFREAAGALVFERTETQVRVTGDGEIRLSLSRSGTLSHQIVSEMMILACTAAADFCRQAGIPAVYRHQPPPDEPLDWDPAKKGDPVAVDAVLRRLKRAELSLHPKAHASLGVETYTQVTSPLRRYQDLVMHRQLRSAVRGEPPVYGETELMAIFAEVEETASAHTAVERDAQRYWVLKLLEASGAQEVDVLVRREIGKRYLVDLLDYGITARFSPRGGAETGDRLRLRISELSPRRDRLVLHD